MITRPLDLASQLRPPPRRNDWVYMVNAALLAGFFLLFGSRFVLSPALMTGDASLRLPRGNAAGVALVAASEVVSVKTNGQIFTDNGLVSQAQLRVWFADKIARNSASALLIRADGGVSLDLVTQVSDAARQAGFKQVSLAIEPGGPALPAGGAGE
ncbi:MAG: biopolymer transporter ExbD [Opitutaceae bacterium]|jgi:biopolymer transport protein ExbD|nr:biopolymer transporter ExbD [Opitutaceae bacterium]